MPNSNVPFEERLLAKVRQQIKSRKVGFLLGAGASHFSGNGYPLAPSLWTAIRERMPQQDQQRIGTQMAEGGVQLEQALDALDVLAGADPTMRHRVAAAIAESFRDVTPPLAPHQSFIARLGTRREPRIPVFSLNYDCLLENGADAEQKHLVDGFFGIFEATFSPSCFSKAVGSCATRRGRRLFEPDRGGINLYKLHGSLGWFAAPDGKLKRLHSDAPCPDEYRRLMVPPSNRKTADTGFTPYALLWSEFRAYLANDASRVLNRLICCGYGFGDGHVNEVIWSGLAREDFTLVVLAKALSDNAFNRLAGNRNTVVVTEARSSLKGQQGAGSADGWSFEWLSREA